MTCIEAGRLESMVLMLAASLRSFDGALSRAPFFAIQPRSGPSIHPRTRAKLAALNVEYIKTNIVGAHGFHGTLNKAAALSWAEHHAETEFVTWADGDTLFIRSPEGVLPDPDVDFNASAGEEDLGTNGTDETAAFWAEISKRFGVDHLRSAQMASEPNGKMIYEYYHGGVFSFRTALGFGAAHFDFIKRLIDTQLSSRVTGTFHHDQMAMTYAALHCAPRRSVLAPEYNCSISPKYPSDVVKAAFETAHVLHYHGCFEPAQAARFIPYFEHVPERQRAILMEHVPVQYETRLFARLWSKALKTRRTAQNAAHEKLCKVI